MRTSIVSSLLLSTFTLASCTAPGASETQAGDDVGTDDASSQDNDDDPADFCGNGIVEPDEECDLGDENGDDQKCTSQCTISSCGDGVLYTGFEACDDGNASNIDDCVEGCELARCGDGFVHTGVEVCDDANQDNADGCTTTCMPSTCGDGVVQDGEQCDDGNADTTDECPACQLAFCGDGFTQAELEQCDDGNQSSDDACLPTFCLPATCGDGFLQTGVEECDDGNDIDDDFCTSQCISLLYWVEGPQIDVPVDMVGGWEECFSDSFSDDSPGLTNTILGQQCTGSRLLIGCRQMGAANFTLLAMGEREDVLFDVGQDEFATHEANGVGWYYSNEWSWGFVLGGDPVQRFSCDVEQSNPEYRMCWHTGGDALNGGYRCGVNEGIWDFNWERVIMQAE